MILDNTFRQEVNRLSGQQVERCYHCHTCTAGCPVAADMQYGPDRLLRLVELGQSDRVLSSSDIWLCVGCQACAERCPNGIGVSQIMDALRQISLAQKVAPAEPNVLLFHRLYLLVIKILGRSHEAMMLMLYKLFSRDLFSDMSAGIALVLRGKIPILARPIRDMSNIRRLYQAAESGDEALTETSECES
jgi:heterodisulfide reductase subunit C